mmetsp:Transcript_31095/g.68888  ORF Transcript_31095/g.68888 Transcript_31095/m.68888 type:complete len:411 (+) Transcript_31095:1736-2968(+)
MFCLSAEGGCGCCCIGTVLLVHDMYLGTCTYECWKRARYLVLRGAVDGRSSMDDSSSSTMRASSLRRRATRIVIDLESQANATGVKWSDIDKVRFYGIGTGMYSALTVLLHPITVVKINQQCTAQPALKDAIWNVMNSGVTSNRPLNKIRPLYRGLGVVLSLAIPARVLYIGVLEGSREGIGGRMTELLVQAVAGPDEAHAMLPLVATVSSGLAGGIAAMAAQCLVVPMDVISQKQMTMDAKMYSTGQGSAISVAKSIIQHAGFRGFFRGFSLSMVSSLPTGSIWWAVYAGCQAHPLLTSYSQIRYGEEPGSVCHTYRKGVVQVLSGVCAGAVAATLTQPLDTVKTILQVKGEQGSSYTSVTKELFAKSGPAGFFRGTSPRIVHMSLWGTVLSSAYEFLRHVSRKDYHAR